MRLSLRLCLIITALLALAGIPAWTQVVPTAVPDTTHPGQDTTGLAREAARPTGGSGADSTRRDSSVVRTGGKSGMDTVVTYSARDSIIVDVRTRKVRLYGDAVVVKGGQRLTAYYIVIDFTSAQLYAEARYDSTTRKYSEVPVFHDVDREFSANSLTYNFQTHQGTLAAAETQFDQGFYYGEKIKRVDENTLFVKNGRYTTCTAPHPHYYFAAPKMEVDVGEKIFADQPTLYVADVPVFYIPFGIFFPNQRGKQSGILIPQWSQSTQRGFALERLGYFWAGNDYVDDRIEADLYTKGGYTFRNYFRYRLRGVIQTSDLNLTWGQTRNNVEDPLTTNFILGYNHEQPIGRRSRIGGTFNFATANAIRNTSNRAYGTPLDDITTRQLSSNFSYGTSWAWGGALSAVYTRSQDIVTNEYTQTLPITFSLPTWTPLASKTGEPGIFDNLALSGGSALQIEDVRRDTIPGGGFRTVDTRKAFNFTPRLSVTPKLGYFNLQPSINYSASIFFRRTVKERVGDTVVTHFIPGVYSAQSYNFSLSASTMLYGIVKPGIFGIDAIRHAIRPTITYTFQPDFGKRGYGYYDQVFDPHTNSIQKYSVFEGDQTVGSTPPAGLRQSVSLGLENTFEAKVAQGDTLPDKTVPLLNFGISTGYNAAAPDFKWDPISIRTSTELGRLGSLSGDATLDLYAHDSLGRPVPHLLIDQGQGLVSASRASVSFSAGFSDQGFGLAPPPPKPSDSAAARRERFDFEEQPFESDRFFGENVEGNGEFRIPWQLNFSGSYNISRSILNPSTFDKFFNISTSFSFSLTPTTKITSQASYDFKSGKFLIPTIGFYKDLDCWEMQFDWSPTGYATGFYFRLGLKAPQLRDLKLERRETFYE